MNWQAINFDWNQVRAFLATAEEGSFSGAARALKTTQPTIGRQISELESRLGITLFERSVRGPTLTEAGQDLVIHVRAMADAATLVSMAALGHSTDVTGEVTITATDLLSTQVLPSVLAPLRQSAPGIRIRIVASNDTQDLLRREADISIRHARPEQPELIGRHVGDFRANLFASETYLEKAGTPSEPKDLGNHAFIGTPDQERLLSALQNQGIPVTAENFVVQCESGVVVWEMLKAGYGVSMMPDPVCLPEPGIVKVMPALPPLQFPIWLVAHREIQTSKRIRIVFDQLAKGLRERSQLK